MSTDYLIVPPIAASELFDGRLEKFGVREHTNKETNERHRMLREGNNYLHVWVGDDGNVGDCQRFFPNGNPKYIFGAIHEVFGCEIYSEHEPQYWGFETEEEWRAAGEAMSKKHDEETLVDLVKYLRGEKHGFKQGTVGMTWAENVKKHFKKDPTLILPENRDKLLQLYRSGRALTDVVVELSPEDMALAEMMATHEKDLPQA